MGIIIDLSIVTKRVCDLIKLYYLGSNQTRAISGNGETVEKSVVK